MVACGITGVMRFEVRGSTNSMYPEPLSSIILKLGLVIFWAAKVTLLCMLIQ
jgi:hypothetical protein